MSKEEIAYLSDLMPEEAAAGHVPAFSRDGKKLVDSGFDAEDIALKSDIASETSAIWDAIENEYALGAYQSAYWVSGNAYYIGDYCRHQKNGQAYGYRCKRDNTGQQDFSEEYWDVVLTPAGMDELDALMDPVNQVVSAVDAIYEELFPSQEE